MFGATWRLPGVSANATRLVGVKMSDFTPGQQLLLDRSLKVRFVRSLPEGRAIIAVGADTRIVDCLILSEEEA